MIEVDVVEVGIIINFHEVILVFLQVNKETVVDNIVKLSLPTVWISFQ